MPAGTVTGDVTNYEITGLIDGSDYFIRVRAENQAGSGKPKEYDDPVKARKPISKNLFSTAYTLRN